MDSKQKTSSKYISDICKKIVVASKECNCNISLCQARECFSSSFGFWTNKHREEYEAPLIIVDDPNSQFNPSLASAITDRILRFTRESQPNESVNISILSTKIEHIIRSEGFRVDTARCITDAKIDTKNQEKILKSLDIDHQDQYREPSSRLIVPAVPSKASIAILGKLLPNPPAISTTECLNELGRQPWHSIKDDSQILVARYPLCATHPSLRNIAVDIFKVQPVSKIKFPSNNNCAPIYAEIGLGIAIIADATPTGVPRGAQGKYRVFTPFLQYSKNKKWEIKLNTPYVIGMSESELEDAFGLELESMEKASICPHCRRLYLLGEPHQCDSNISNIYLKTAISSIRKQGSSSFSSEKLHREYEKVSGEKVSVKEIAEFTYSTKHEHGIFVKNGQWNLTDSTKPATKENKIFLLNSPTDTYLTEILAREQTGNIIDIH